MKARPDLTRRPERFDIDVRSHRLHARRFGAETDPLVLCVPGLTGHSGAFDPLGAAIVDALQLVAVDLRGRGRSETTPPGSYGWANHARDLFAVAAALGFDRFSVVGLSMGGSVAMAAADLDAARIDAIVLVDVAGRVDRGVGSVVEEVVAQIDATYESADTYVTAMKDTGLIAPWQPSWDRYFRDQLVEAEGGGVRPRVHPAAIDEDRRYGATQDPYERSANLTMPTLLLRATRELRPGSGLVVPAGDRERFERRVPGATIVDIDANHLTVSADPKALALIADFLVAATSPR